MAKIGTAHIEIKPVLNDTTLEVISKVIEEAVARGIARGAAPSVYLEHTTATGCTCACGDPLRECQDPLN
jgi:hypothetical protein